MKAKIPLMEYIKLCGSIPDPIPEFQFAPPRKWRLDYGWPEEKLALEIEGGIWIRGRHTRPKGFIADMEKYNELAILGWRLLRVTPQQIQTGEAISLLTRCFNG
jgi:very-short-patch-repair endonuclease